MSALTYLLEKNGFTKDEIWKRIGNDNNYDDSKDKYIKAKLRSKKEINELKEEIKIIINKKKH